MSSAEVSIRYLIAKRLFDLAVCILLLPVVLPLLLLCALAIRLDSPGPIFIAQERTGRDGTPFRMLKFRTMVRNAAELKAELAHLNVLPPPDFKIPDDPRITRVGKLLRQTSLDELPQLSMFSGAICPSSDPGQRPSPRPPTSSGTPTGSR